MHVVCKHGFTRWHRTAACPAPHTPPVRVLLNGVRHVVVDHQRHVCHVDTAARHIGGHQHVVLALAEALQKVGGWYSSAKTACEAKCSQHVVLALAEALLRVVRR